MIIKVDHDEWYPVYSISERGYSSSEEVEVDEDWAKGFIDAHKTFAKYQDAIHRILIEQEKDIETRRKRKQMQRDLDMLNKENK